VALRVQFPATIPDCTFSVLVFSVRARAMPLA